MSKKKRAHPTLFLVPTSLTGHPVPVEAMNLFGSVKSGRGLFTRLGGAMLIVAREKPEAMSRFPITLNPKP